MSEPARTATRSSNLRAALLGLAIVLVTPVLLYLGYCWGLLGEGGGFFQYAFQCVCPTSSEQARYPDREILVPACQADYVSLDPIPGGEYVTVYEHRGTELGARYILNVHTKERIPYPLDAAKFGSVIISETLAVSLGNERWGDAELVEWRTGRRAPLIQLDDDLIYEVPSTSQAITELMGPFHEAQEIYLIDNRVAVAVMASPWEVPSRNHILELRPKPGGRAGGDLSLDSDLQPLFEAQGLDPIRLPALECGLDSPDGRYRFDCIVERGFPTYEYGIYSFEHDRILVQESFIPVDWTSDSRGVIGFHGKRNYVIDVPIAFSLRLELFRLREPAFVLLIPRAP